MSNAKIDKKRIFAFVIIGIVALLIGLYSYISPKPTGDEIMDAMVKVIFTRFLGTIAFIVLMKYIGYGRPLKICDRERHAYFLKTLPFFLVVINNFPIIGLVTGNAELTKTTPLAITLFILENLAIACFEEFAFRGTLFLYILESRKRDTKQIFWVCVISSLIFGCVHLFNLLEGGGPGVFLQVGYSFLIGGMCCVALLLTKNLWICVILHFLFDLGGKMIQTLGHGIIWDKWTVIITAVLGIMTLVHALFVMKKITVKDAEELY